MRQIFTCSFFFKYVNKFSVVRLVSNFYKLLHFSNLVNAILKTVGFTSTFFHNYYLENSN